MPVIPNRNYNDPNIGQAFTNLAGMFAPPSAQEALAYMKAKESADETARRAKMFAYATDPNYSREQADRYGVLGGLFAPNQSYYSVDTGAATSRSNNAADNARALQVAKMQEEANTARALLQPLGEGQSRFVPGPLAQQHGLSSGPQIGIVKTNPGQTATLPDGRVLAGAPEMPSETQARGRLLLERAPRMSDAELGAIVMGNTPIAQVQTPTGPQWAYNNQAVGQPVGMDPTKAGKAVNYVTPDNRKGSAVQSPSGKLVDSQTGEDLPAGTTTFSGLAQPGDLKNTEFNLKNGMFVVRASNADQNMKKVLSSGYAPSARDYELVFGAGAMLPTSIANYAMSPAGQQFYTAAQDFMMSVLRPDTGAAFGRDEFASYARVFIPLPGDTPEVLADKMKNRQTALAALAGTSNTAAADIVTKMQQLGVDPSEMMQQIAKAKAAAPAASAPQPNAAAPQQSPATGGLPDGAIARHPQTGERIIRKNGQWVPYGQ